MTGRFSRWLWTAALSVPLAIAAQQASATLVAGSAIFSDTGPSGNGLSFSGAFHPSSFSFNAAYGTPYTINDFLTVTSNDDNRTFWGNEAATDSLLVSFTITQPAGGNGAIPGSGTETLSFFFGSISGGSGAIHWTAPAVITFADNEQLSIALSDASFDVHSNPDQSVLIDATFTLTGTPAAIPEPASIALFGAGLLGLGLAARRRRP